MDAYVIWFIVAGVLAGVEMLTGTLYLLMIALGAAAGGLAALAGAALVWQFLAAAVVSVSGMLSVRRGEKWGHRRGHKSTIAFDAGQSVEVIERHADGSLRVSYRGSQWDAELDPSSIGVGAPALYVIKETRGSRLILEARK